MRKSANPEPVKSTAQLKRAGCLSCRLPRSSLCDIHTEPNLMPSAGHAHIIGKLVEIIFEIARIAERGMLW